MCYHRVLPVDRKTEYFLPDLVVTPESFRKQHVVILGSLMALELFARLFVDGDKELIEPCRVNAPPPQMFSLETVP